MLGREDGFGRFVVPSQRREADSDFDWEQRNQVSERARVALDFSARVLAESG
jgi:hypothetical protein